MPLKHFGAIKSNDDPILHFIQVIDRHYKVLAVKI